MKNKFIAVSIIFTSVLFTLPAKAGNPEHLKQLRETKQCQQCDLSGFNLSGVDLSFAVLVGANLSGANLRGANLKNADLTGTNLTKADLSGANLNQAYLNNANLHQTKFMGASLRNTRGLPIMTAIAPVPKIKIPPLPPINKLPSTKLILPRLPLPRPRPRLRIPPLPRPRSTFLSPAPLITPKKPINSQGRSPQPYPDKLKQAFLKSCSQNMQPKMQPTCSCMLNRLEKEYSLSEFLRISFELADGKQLPAGWMQIGVECVKEVVSAANNNPF
ncbi:MAG: pentapeptide repeat-containing protein [Calothrix sp. MO_192.B10]|nr:pentapeptide repeat-containing protein [Calothrix sp. MO_192.B10]